MFKLLLVDDELLTRRRILKGVRWDELGIGEVREADDGRTAMKLCEDFTPDILLTDIRMPVMDGIDLASRLAEHRSRMKVIFISGYTDKEYLKGAIRLSAVNYIEKPIRLAELEAAVASAVARLREEHETEKKVNAFERDRMADRYGELASMLCQDPSQAPPDYGALPDPFREATLFLSALVKVISCPADEDFSSVADRMIQTIYEIHRTGASLAFFPLCIWKRGYLIMHLAGQKASSNYNDYKNVDQFCSFLSKRFISLGIDTAIGVGSLEERCGRIYNSYETAVLTVQQFFFRGNETTAYYRGGPAAGYQFQDRQKEEFARLLKGDTATPAVRFVRNLASDIKGCTSTLVSNAHRFYFDLFRALMERAGAEGATLRDDIPDNPAELWERIALTPSIDALTDYLADGIDAYFTALFQSGAASPAISSALQLIRKRYDDPDLCITMLSQYCGLSPAYFCRVFRQETGSTPNSYILDYRMRKAQALLQNPRCKVKEIASLVGYRDGNYFSSQFKRHVGETPSEYRERVL